MRISAKSDYALRALIELAHRGSPATIESIAGAQGIPHKYLEAILVHLRNTGFVASLRGQEGGYRLERAAAAITVADVLRTMDGPIATVRGECPQDVEYIGHAKPLQGMWIAVRASMRLVLEHVTIADLAAGNLPEAVEQLAADPDAWTEHWYY